jgi:predicted transcriptional regulator of viral defense system
LSNEVVDIKHDKFFRDNPVFTSSDFWQYLFSRNIGKRTQDALINYYRKTGRIINIKRGLYATVPAGSTPETFTVDPYLLASKLTPDAVISHLSVLGFFGNIYSIRNMFTYSASRPVDILAFQAHSFKGTRFPKTLVDREEEMFEVRIEERAGMNLRVTTLERALVDILDRPELCGSWEEIWRSLESIDFFDLDKVLEYVLLIGNSTTTAKVGFFLEQHREELMVEDHYLEKLGKLRPRNPHYFSRTRREPGIFVSKWNLVVPEEVLKRSWGEIL